MPRSRSHRCLLCEKAIFRSFYHYFDCGAAFRSRRDPRAMYLSYAYFFLKFKPLRSSLGARQVTKFRNGFKKSHSAMELVLM
jgi:hypothetical protein